MWGHWGTGGFVPWEGTGCRVALSQGPYPDPICQGSASLVVMLCMEPCCRPTGIPCTPLSHDGHRVGDKDSPGDPPCIPCPCSRDVLGMLAVGFAPSQPTDPSHPLPTLCLVNNSAARSRCFGVLIRRARRWGERKTAQRGKGKSSPGLQSS